MTNQQSLQAEMLVDIEIIDLLVVEMLAVEVIRVIPISLAVATIPPTLYPILANCWADEGLDGQMLRNDGLMKGLKL